MFDLVSTTVEDYFTIKVKSTYTGGLMTYLSAGTANVSIMCGYNHTISEGIVLPP